MLKSVYARPPQPSGLSKQGKRVTETHRRQKERDRERDWAGCAHIHTLVWARTRLQNVCIKFYHHVRHDKIFYIIYIWHCDCRGHCVYHLATTIPFLFVCLIVCVRVSEWVLVSVCSVAVVQFSMRWALHIAALIYIYMMGCDVIHT